MEGRAARITGSPSCKSAGHFVQFEKTGAQALDALAGVEKDVEAAFVLFDNPLGIEERIGRARVAQLEQTLFGAGQDLIGLVFGAQATIDQRLRSEDDAPQDGLVLDDPDVALQIGEHRQAFVQRYQVADAIHRFELILLHQLVGHGHAIDLLAALIQLAHAQEDAPMLFQAEIRGFERARHLDVQRRVHQNRAQDEPFGVQILRESLFERDVRRCRHKPTVPP